MGEDGPAWYYVEGQLPYRDRDGWTDRYQTIAPPGRTSLPLISQMSSGLRRERKPADHMSDPAAGPSTLCGSVEVNDC